LQVMRETKVMPSPIDTPPAVAPPQETPVSSAPVAIEVPAASSQHAKKREKDEKLYAQIENVLASVKRFIVEGHYGRARENLYAVLRLDPENEEARALIIELDRIMAEREQQKTASEERRIHDEQPREHYFAEQERRRAMRRKIEKKYTQWSEINDQAVHLEVNAKVAEKLYRAEKALVQKNYFGARQELDLLFVLAPDNVEGRALEAKLQNEIEYLQALIEDDVLALRERDQAPAVSDKNDNEQIITMTNDAVMAAETSQKSETEPPVEIARHETQKASGSATIETAYSEKTGRAQSSLFDVISNFRPFTLLTGEENTMQDVKVSEDEPVREKSVRKERTKRQRSVKDKKRVSENKSDTTSEAVLSNEVMPADEKCSKRKLLEYLTRGKRHFMQENYPLALVSFNKVKSLDKDGIYSSEVEKLIAITKKRLEKRK